MKKILYTVSVVLLLVISMYSYKQENLKNKEVMNLSEDIVNDYEDIIIRKGNDDEKVIALTFDDGPDVDFTPQILDILKKHDVKATFL